MHQHKQMSTTLMNIDTPTLILNIHKNTHEHLHQTFTDHAYSKNLPPKNDHITRLLRRV